MQAVKIQKILKDHENEIKRFGVQHLALFGSAARNEMNSKSDVDILVDFDPKKGLFVFIDLKFYLEKLLDSTVDLVSKKALHPALKTKILKDVCMSFRDWKFRIQDIIDSITKIEKLCNKYHYVVLCV